LTVVAQQFSPRYETRGDLVVVDVRGLERLFGDARAIAEELRREAADRGLRVHVAIAATQTAAVVLAIARAGVAVIEPGAEASAIAPVAIEIFGRPGLLGRADGDPESVAPQMEMFRRWGLRTLGEIAALPADELSARMGRQGRTWHAIARGADVHPLVPDVEAERFDASLELEWPIDGLEPLSFVLTRLLEPLSLRLEQRDRGVAVLHVELRLVTKETYARRLELPTPMRDVKTLRTLVLLDLEAQSLFTPGAAAPRTATLGEHVGIDRVGIVIDPTPGRVWQHTLFARPHPTPEQLSTLLARLGAAMGQDRVGAPVLVDTYRPGAFAMAPFATVHDDHRGARNARSLACSAVNVVAVRRCRQPVPAVVAVNDSGAPMKVVTHRRGFGGGSVLRATGPWKTSGEWWADSWNRDEWDVALSDGASYRVFLDHSANRWFIDAILD
jgi:protein ImuB